MVCSVREARGGWGVGACEEYLRFVQVRGWGKGGGAIEGAEKECGERREEEEGWWEGCSQRL